jgi:hypothetical protein
VLWKSEELSPKEGSNGLVYVAEHETPTDGTFSAFFIDVVYDDPRAASAPSAWASGKAFPQGWPGKKAAVAEDVLPHKLIPRDMAGQLEFTSEVEMEASCFSTHVPFSPVCSVCVFVVLPLFVLLSSKVTFVLFPLLPLTLKNFAFSPFALLACCCLDRTSGQHRARHLPVRRLQRRGLLRHSRLSCCLTRAAGVTGENSRQTYLSYELARTEANAPRRSERGGVGGRTRASWGHCTCVVCEATQALYGNVRCTCDHNTPANKTGFN